MSDEKTIRVYNTQFAEYARVSGDYAANNPQLAAFIGACPTGGQVLDLGCGPGQAANLMAVAGLNADAMDASAEMVTLAAQHPGVNARRASFHQISGTDQYDGIWANFSLLHAPRADFPAHLAAIHAALKPNGIFFIALKTGAGEARDKLGRFYTYYTPEELCTHLETAGFTVTDQAYGQGKGLDGSMSDWISVATHA